MIKIIFSLFVLFLMARNFMAWMKIDKKIGESLNWSTVDAELLDYQIMEKSATGIKRFQNNRQCFAYARFTHEGTIVGCQAISFYPNTHIINLDYLNELTNEKTVTVWFDPSAPGNNVLLNPENHGRGLLLAKTLATQASCLTMIALALLV
jgi:hypothetical protein